MNIVQKFILKIWDEILNFLKQKAQSTCTSSDEKYMYIIPGGIITYKAGNEHFAKENTKKQGIWCAQRTNLSISQFDQFLYMYFWHARCNLQ